MSTYLEFLHNRIGGKNWVIARRTPNIVRRYGEDVICVSRKRYAQIEREYRTLYGDPYDQVRADLYLTLKDARLMLYAWKAARRNLNLPDNHTELNQCIARVEAAITAEANA